MKSGVLFCFILVIGSIGFAQDEYITIMDFEGEIVPTVSAGWDFTSGLNAEGEPVHGGTGSFYLDIVGGTSEWVFGTWTFPAETGTLDLSNTDEIGIWVNATAPFQMNLEFGGANLGYRTYTEADVGKWTRLVWWYPEETASAFTAITGWGGFINPTAMNDLPADFTGVIFFDDIQARVRADQGEREFFLVNGFNTQADLANVTLNPDYEIGLVTDGEVEPSEGEGYLAVMLSDAGNDRFTLDLKSVPQFKDYDRIYFDLYMNGTASGGWGNFGLRLDYTVLDEQGNIVLDTEGNPETEDFTLVNGSYQAVATQQWHTFVQQYGPVAGTEGYPLQTFKQENIDPMYDKEGATLTMTLSTNGGGVEEVPLYIDNIRLSRPSGAPVKDWDLF